MTDDLLPPYFTPLKVQYFNPLCQRLGLSIEVTFGNSEAGHVSASSGAVRVFFEYERGLSFFSLGPANSTAPTTGVEAIASRFTRVHQLRQGAQRLNLEEQASLIARHWPELQTMYSRTR